MTATEPASPEDGVAGRRGTDTFGWKTRCGHALRCHLPPPFVSTHPEDRHCHLTQLVVIVFFKHLRLSVVISVLLVTSREEEMKFISQLSVPLLYGQIHLVSTF